ncbi:MAG: class I SAM-dependent methyltransferase [Chloroflexi bacterium]|nr:class I SAM-dependent methyltransferase [Chloroflexota bacterium]
MDFVSCVDCQFTFNRIFRPMDYREDIETSRRHSEFFNNYLISVCRQVDEVCSIRGKVVVEVGCGDGHFLTELRKLFEFEGWGFDPSFVKTDTVPHFKDLRFIADNYPSDALNKAPDLIAFRHVVEHIASLKHFLAPMIADPERRPSWIYIEVPDWEWIIDNDQIMMFSNDHCSYYSRPSMDLAMRACGFAAEKMSVTFADEYLQYFGKSVDSSIDRSEHRQRGADLTKKTKAFIARIPTVLERFRSYFSETSGQAVLWGAAGKGTILLPTLGVSHKQLPFVVDSNPNRQGTYIPVTGQEVIPPNRLKTLQPRYVLITNPSYQGEIAAQLDALGVEAQIMNVE